MSEYNEKETTEVQEDQKSWEHVLNNEPSVLPVVDIYETGEAFVLKANLPGVSKDNVHLKLEEGNLAIFGKVKYDEVYKKEYILKESLFANYFRNFKLTDSIDSSKIDANFENGQLVVTLPKHDKAKPRNISVK